MAPGGLSPTNYTLTITPTHVAPLPRMNRQKSPNNIIIQAYDPTFFTSPTPSYSFHGSNSSHSKDSGCVKNHSNFHSIPYTSSGKEVEHTMFLITPQGSYSLIYPDFTIHAMQRLDLNSYANEKTHLISVAFDEHKGANRLIISIVFMFLLLFGSTVYVIVNKPEKSLLALQTAGGTEWSGATEPLVQYKKGTSPPTMVQTTNTIFEERESGDGDGLISGEEIGITSGSGLYWDELKGSTHCTGYGTRRYSARLRNVPFWANRTRACLETPVQINGVTLPSPDECEVDVSSFVSLTGSQAEINIVVTGSCEWLLECQFQ